LQCKSGPAPASQVPDFPLQWQSASGRRSARGADRRLDRGERQQERELLSRAPGVGGICAPRAGSGPEWRGASPTTNTCAILLDTRTHRLFCQKEAATQEQAGRCQCCRRCHLRRLPTCSRAQPIALDVGVFSTAQIDLKRIWCKRLNIRPNIKRTSNPQVMPACTKPMFGTLPW